MGPGARIAEFVSEYPEQEIPERALERAKRAVIDYVGVVAAGMEEVSSQVVRKTAEAQGGNPQATIWGTGRKTSVLLAALINGTAAHALDYDDVSPVMMGHPSIQILPGLCALGEFEKRSGADIMASYVIGFEVGAALGSALNPEHVAQGWLPIGTFGPVMQAAACSRLLKLSSRRTMMALGIAANCASGLRCNSGTMAKPLLAGQASANGLSAALLAREGMEANPNVFEDPFGYFANFCRGNPDHLERAAASLGKRFEILETGIHLKMYPCCAASHRAVDCALEIARGHGRVTDDIESVEVILHALHQTMLIHPRPRSVAEARFSLEYGVARALMDGELGPGQFQPRKIEDPAVQALIRKVNPEYRDYPTGKGDLGKDRFPVVMKVRLRDGSVLSSKAVHAKGTPANPATEADLEKKFRGCLSGRSSESRISEVLSYLRNMEQIRDFNKVVSILP